MSGGSSSASASVSSPSLSPSLSKISADENPLWSYVKRLGKVGRCGGGTTWVCNYCNEKKTTSLSRLEAHLLLIPGGGIKCCKEVKPENLEEMKKKVAQFKNKKVASAPKKVPLPPPIGSSSRGDLYTGVGGGVFPTKKSGGSSSLAKAFNVRGRHQLDASIGRMFYSAGLPFNLAKNPNYVHSYMFATSNKNLSGYKPPSYNALRTTLLQQEVAHVKRLLAPIRATWKEKGVSIVTDGWSDSQRRPLINFLAVSESGPMFLKAVDCTGEIKDKYFIFNLMKTIIEEVGAENVVQVITDNARNCSSAGSLIEGAFPHIVWTPCVVHTLNLALQNICAAKNVENNRETFDACEWISIIAADVNMIKNFIMDHGMRLAIFNEFSPLKLLSVAATRFASILVMLRRFRKLKSCLEQMVISEQWSEYREGEGEKASFVKMKVLDDAWWDKIDYILDFTAPIYSMLRECDTDSPSLHLVYDMWDCMIEKVKLAIYKHEKKELEDASDFYDVVHAILVSRWNKNNTPLHCLAHSLNPRYYSRKWLNEDPSRKAPHKDKEISLGRIKCLKKYFPDEEEKRIATEEFALFSSMTGDFSDGDSMKYRDDMDPRTWWVTYGSFAPKLQTLALKLLAQPSSSSAAERNWSTYSFIHSLKMNKLTVARALDLVFVHSNLRLLSRRTPEYRIGETKLWDISGDDFGTLDDIGILETAHLSLDEPELEQVIFLDDDGNDARPKDGVDDDEMDEDEEDIVELDD